MGLTAVAIHNEERGRMVATELNALAKVTGAPKVQAIARLFHSAPVITGERCEREIGDLRIKRGFNPRPPSLASGARHTDTGGMPPACFNPRPPSLASGALDTQVVVMIAKSSVFARTFTAACPAKSLLCEGIPETSSTTSTYQVREPDG